MSVAKIKKEITGSVKNWYLLLIAGIVLVAAGIYSFTRPADTYMALVIVFSASFFVAGLFESIFSFINREEIEGWGWSFFLGLMTLLVGVMLMTHPEVTIVTLPFFVGFTLLFRSASAMAQALQLKELGVLDWGNLMVLGVLGTIFSFILLFNPLLAGMTAVTWTALAFLMLGGFSIYTSFKLKEIKDGYDETKKAVEDKKKEIEEKQKKAEAKEEASDEASSEDKDVKSDS